MRWFASLTPEVQAQTPAPVRQLVQAMQARIDELEARVAQLQARLQQNSQNSSRPPSTDPPAARQQRRRHRPSSRRPGGQPDHAPATRPLVPVAEVTAVVVCKPNACQHCQQPLAGDDRWFRRHQVFDLPPIRPTVHEYQLHTLTCPHCQRTTAAALPAGVPAGLCGPRLQAMLAVCTGVYQLSKRQTQDLLRDFFAFDLSLGSVGNIEQLVSAALAAPVAAVQQAIGQQPVVHADETRWPEGKRATSPGYLWVAVTAYLACFLIRSGRNKGAAQELLGVDFAGILVSDRYASYHWVGDGQRQFCWAHLRRDWQAMAERGGTSGVVGRRLLVLTDEWFRWWHKLREGKWSRERFQCALYRTRQEVHNLLERGRHCAQAATAGTCAELLAHESALWTFVDHEGVEPTNNLAERVLRPAVLWRRRSYGTRSASGSRFVERMLTVVTSCRLQERNVLDYITEACSAAVAGKTAPSLLPRETRRSGQQGTRRIARRAAEVAAQHIK
jgi:transposase